MISTYIGTDDAGATEQDPTGGGLDPDNNMVLVTVQEYDDGQDAGDGNLTQQTQHVDATTTRVTTFDYDWRNRRTTTDGELDFYQTDTYDNLNHVIQTDRYDTDVNGNLIARSQTKYDNRGRVYRTLQFAVDPNTGTIGDSLADNVWYDASGHVIERQPSGLMTSFEMEYDSLGRLVKEINPLAAETDYTYDDANNRLTLTDAEDNTTTWSYDGIGRVVAETNELNESRTWSYNTAGMVGERTDRNGRVIEFDYDAAGRLTEERWKTGGSTVNALQFAYDADGRQSTASDDFSSYAYSYDLNGAMSEVDNDGTPDVPQVILSAAYNRQVEQTSLAAEVASVNDFLNDYQYDALGRMSRLNQQGNGGNTVSPKRIDFRYNVLGNYSEVERFADLSATQQVVNSEYSYDDYNRLIDIDHLHSTTSLAQHEYQWNANRLIDQYTSTDGTANYDYDAAAQLTEADYSFQPDEDFLYDLTGNRTNSGYSTGDNNQLLSDGVYNYNYDAEGNRSKRTTIGNGDTVDYEWDHRNRLTKVTFKDSLGAKTKEIEYIYDLNNRRIGKLLDSNGNDSIDEEWRYVYNPMTHFDLASIILTFDANGDLRQRYLQGPNVDQILATEDDNNDILWPLTDNLGTVRDLAEYDSGLNTTSIVNHLTYNAFGHITSQTTPTLTPHFSFTGREWDADAELFYYRARWYDAVAGRFVSTDPIGFSGGDANLYRYVRNSPVMLTDPSGMVVPIVIVGGVVVIGGASITLAEATAIAAAFGLTLTTCIATPACAQAIRDAANALGQLMEGLANMVESLLRAIGRNCRVVCRVRLHPPDHNFPLPDGTPCWRMHGQVNCYVPGFGGIDQIFNRLFGDQNHIPFGPCLPRGGWPRPPAP